MGSPSSVLAHCVPKHGNVLARIGLKGAWKTKYKFV